MVMLRRLSAALATWLLLASQSTGATELEAQKITGPAMSPAQEMSLPMAKAASTNTVASRAIASQSTTVYGGFELASGATVYILVRGNSLGTLGVTSNYLDAPRVRLYNSQGQDLIQDGSGRAGFNGCVSSNTTTDLPVINYYQNVRGQPTQPRDTCLAVSAPAGAYTFSVTPSIPGVTTSSTTSSPASGEILFEVTLGPPGTSSNPNYERSARLVGGTWTYTYNIISTFSDSYTFTSVSSTPNSNGHYAVTGTNPSGRPVVGLYDAGLNLWAVLYRGFTIDYFYTFNFSDNNRVSGCYYQISPSGSSNLSRCYSMSGIRVPFQMALGKHTQASESKLIAEVAGESAEFLEPAVERLYQTLREGLASHLTPMSDAGAPKAAITRSVASRATVSPGSTVYGGFELAASANVYILVRGNSLGSLGVTQGFLDAPRVRVYNAQGQDLFVDANNRAGFNVCSATNSLNSPVVSYYQNVRGAPVHGRDACVAASYPAGAYTFSVTPSIPGSTSSSTTSSPSTGEVLFEVTLGP